MARPLVSDELWELVEPLIPKVRAPLPVSGAQADRRPEGVDWDPVRAPERGSRGSTAPGDGLRLGDDLLAPAEGVAAGGRLAALHELLLAKLNEAERIDWSRAVIDSSHVRAVGGATRPVKPCRPRQERLQAPYADLRTGHAARALTQRRQPQRHPRAAAARRRDPPVRGKRGRPRRRPRRGCSATAPTTPAATAASCAPAGSAPTIPRPKQPHGSGLGKQRWVVERTIAWLHQYRRLRVRYERRADIHEAFLQIAGCLICLKLRLGVAEQRLELPRRRGAARIAVRAGVPRARGMRGESAARRRGGVPPRGDRGGWTCTRRCSAPARCPDMSRAPRARSRGRPRSPSPRRRARTARSPRSVSAATARRGDRRRRAPSSRPRAPSPIASTRGADEDRGAARGDRSRPSTVNVACPGITTKSSS